MVITGGMPDAEPSSKGILHDNGTTAAAKIEDTARGSRKAIEETHNLSAGY